jgi:hypothetical protein
LNDKTRFCLFNVLVFIAILIAKPTKLNAQSLVYQPIKYVDANLINKTIDNHYAIGTIAGSSSVDLLGGSNYSIPIYTPLGTNNMIPQVSARSR